MWQCASQASGGGRNSGLRVFGSGANDVDRPKVDVIGDNLERIADDVVLEKIQSMLTLEATAKRFAGCDVIFGCTDDNAGRLVLSRLSTYYLIPVFDCGMLLSSGGSPYQLNPLGINPLKELIARHVDIDALHSREAPRLLAWSGAILDASRKRLAVHPDDGALRKLWAEYRRTAHALWKRLK